LCLLKPAILLAQRSLAWRRIVVVDDHYRPWFACENKRSAISSRGLLDSPHAELAAGCALLGLNVKQRALKALLAQYKHFEQEIIPLTSMAQDDCYYTMLVERLRLTNWGLQ
jgi:hypothetical protein